MATNRGLRFLCAASVSALFYFKGVFYLDYSRNLLNNLRYLRKKRKYSQEAISEKIGINRKTYSRFETYDLENNSVLTLISGVCKEYEITPNDLLCVQMQYAEKKEPEEQILNDKMNFGVIVSHLEGIMRELENYKK